MRRENVLSLFSSLSDQFKLRGARAHGVCEVAQGREEEEEFMQTKRWKSLSSDCSKPSLENKLRFHCENGSWCTSRGTCVASVVKKKSGFAFLDESNNVHCWTCGRAANFKLNAHQEKAQNQSDGKIGTVDGGRPIENGCTRCHATVTWLQKNRVDGPGSKGSSHICTGTDSILE